MSTYTIVAFIVLPIAGGVIAWLGDVIGYRVGKRRSSLFGLRPRLTARAIGVTVGIILPIVGLGVAAAGSQYARLALFHLEDLNKEQQQLRGINQDLSRQVARAKQDLTEAEKHTQEASTRADKLAADVKHKREQLSRAQSELGTVQRRLDQANEELVQLRADTDTLREERESLIAQNTRLNEDLRTLEVNYNNVSAELTTANQHVAQAQERIDNLEVTEAALNSHIHTLENRLPVLQQEVSRLQQQIEQARAELSQVQEELFVWRVTALGPVVYETGDEIIRAVVETQQTHNQIESSLYELLFLASKAAASQGAPIGKTGRAVAVHAPVPPEDIDREVSEERIINALAGEIRRWEEGSVVVSIRAIGRVFKAQPKPVPVGVLIIDNRRAFEEGQTIVTMEIDGGSPRAEVFQNLWLLLGQIRQAAQEHGVLPAPGTGQYGEVRAEQLLTALDKLLAAGRPTPVCAAAAQPVYIANQQPFSVALKVGEPSESGSS